jgi:4-hydroxy-2-oxoheptanedioate aldolase
MAMPENRLKRALADGQTQIGLWCSLASHITTEIVAGAGFDWILIDTEHAPNDLTSVHRQLQAAAAAGPDAATPVVRPAWNDPVLFKRFLDIGVQSFLVPYVQNADEARRAVAATRYPPAGMRGVAVNTRASRYGRVPTYYQDAQDRIFLMLQIETREALDNLEAIAAVDGVDGLFIGPSDLAASLGYLGQNAHPEARAATESAIARIQAAGRIAGILAPVEADARLWLERGCRFVAVGADLGLLARTTEALAAKFKTGR